MTDAAGFPELQTLVAFSSHYTDTTPDWDDLSGRELGFTIRRGRQAFSSQPDGAVLTLTLDNTDGQLDPSDPDAPYYGQIRPMRLVREVATVDGTPFLLYTGYSGPWRQSWPGGAQDCIIETTALDRTKLLDRLEDTNSRPAETADVRITALLQHAGIGAVDRSINPDDFAARHLHQHPYVNDNVWPAVQDAAHSDGGLVFVDSAGVICFQTVRYRQIGGSPRARESQATFGDGSDAIPVENDLSSGPDDTVMANHVTATDHAGGVHTAQDAVLVEKDGPLNLDLGSTLLEPTDCQDRVDDALALLKEPTPRFPTVTVDLVTLTTAQQLVVLGLGISDRVTVARIPESRGTGEARDQWIESIDHSVDVEARAWTVTFGLSSAGDAAVAIP